MIHKSPEQKELLKALVAFSAEIQPIAKDSSGNRAKYAKLEALVGATKTELAKHGLYLDQWPITIDGKYYLWTEVSHAPSGQFRGSACMLSEKASTGEQAFGSAVTYISRYVMGRALNLEYADEHDNDGDHPQDSGKPSEPSNDKPKDYKFTPGKPISEKQLGYIQRVLGNKKDVLQLILDRCKIKTLPEMTQEHFDEMLTLAKTPSAPMMHKPEPTPPFGSDFDELPF